MPAKTVISLTVEFSVVNDTPVINQCGPGRRVEGRWWRQMGRELSRQGSCDFDRLDLLP